MGLFMKTLVALESAIINTIGGIPNAAAFYNVQVLRNVAENYVGDYYTTDDDVTKNLGYFMELLGICDSLGIPAA